jgi:putative phosphoribosyl transferase
MFSDRGQVGSLLGARLERYRAERPLVIGAARGGVVVGAWVAEALDAPLEVVVARKLGARGRPEIPFGAVADGRRPVVVRDEGRIQALSLSPKEVECEVAYQLALVRTLEAAYRRVRPPVRVEGATVIAVDDGIATGASMRAVLRSLRRHRPRRLVLAVPLAPADALRALRGEADEVVCLTSPYPFVSLRSHYAHFPPVGDAEVIERLAAAAARIERAAPELLAPAG